MRKLWKIVLWIAFIALILNTIMIYTVTYWIIQERNYYKHQMIIFCELNNIKNDVLTENGLRDNVSNIPCDYWLMNK